MKVFPLVSVIIPTYNKAQYLKEAIESVLNQTYKNIELIIIDDGSTDNTAEIIKLFNDNRIVYFYQNNKGPAAARNTGIEMARGEFIAFLDSDDFWLKDKLEKQIKFLEENGKVGLLGTGFYKIDENKNVTSKKQFPTDNNLLQKILIKFNPFAQSSVVIRKEVIQKVGKYDESFLESEDYDFWLRIARHYKIANLPECLVMKRFYKENLSPAKDKKQLNFNLKAKKNAILRGQYPKWCYFYLIQLWLFAKTPFFLRRLIRKILKP